MQKKSLLPVEYEDFWNPIDPDRRTVFPDPWETFLNTMRAIEEAMVDGQELNYNKARTEKYKKV